ncbi:MAG: tetratricopeptide repeat protein [candidate division WOR-3 bacterium]
MQKVGLKALALVIVLITFLSNCAYYNTLYNAKKYYQEGLNRLPTNPALAKTSFNKAIEKSALVISNYPKSKYVADALFIIGMSNYYLGEYTKAIAKFENLALVFPSYHRFAEANFYWAASLIETQNYNDAQERLQTIEKSKTPKPLQEQILLKTAELYYHRAEYNQALDVLQKFINDYPKSAHAQNALLMLGNVQKALTDYNAAIITFQTILNKTLKQTKNYTDTSFLYRQINLHIAECYLKSNQTDKGLQLIDEVIKKDTFLDPKTKAASKIFLDLGNLLLQHNLITRAQDMFRLVRTMPEQIEAYYRLGNSYEVLEKFDSAQIYYDSVIKKQSEGELNILAQSRLELLKFIVIQNSNRSPTNINYDSIQKPLSKENKEEKIEIELFNDTNPELQSHIPKEIYSDSIRKIQKETIPKPDPNFQITNKDTVMQIDSAAFYFHLAEIYNLNLKQYERALEEYEKVYLKYPRSIYAPKAMLAQAWLYDKIFNADNPQHPLHSKRQQVLNKIITNYPQTSYAQMAQQMLKQIQKENKNQ